jgi:hypothetical protein
MHAAELFQLIDYALSGLARATDDENGVVGDDSDAAAPS